MPFRAVRFVLLALAPSLALAQMPRPVPNSDVPVSRIVLFSSGVGYFEHAGTVRGNASTELHFRTAQINDILKSLLLQDEDGGRVGAITYPSQDPLAKTLRSFQVDITRNPSLADLLNQLRGARVSIQTQGERVAGTILGVETRVRSTTSGEATLPMLNLFTGATIRSIDLQSIAALSLEDPQLQDELTKALGALTQARDQDRKPVTINFSGVGDRRVKIGYVVETPVWKTSYRLAVNGDGKKAWLQGWAIIENQTESDWNNVSLNLVSGRPISFTMDLYQPLYATRPNVVPEQYAGLRPQVYDAGIEAGKARVAMDSVRAAPAPAQRRIGYDADGRPTVMQLNSVVVTGVGNEREPNRFGSSAAPSVEAIAAATRLGTLTQFTVPNVTLARQKSAMLPIITDSIPVERLSIYNASALRTNPLFGLWLHNRTGKSLLQGPVTVLDRGSYAGDARLDDVPMGQDRFLSYGIDLDLTVDNSKLNNSAAFMTASLYKGSLIMKRKRVMTRTYETDNKSDRDRTLVIEHPRTTGWSLNSSQKPFETTPALYRFKGTAPANKVTTLTVSEEVVDDEWISLANTDLPQLVVHSRNTEIPARVREALSKAIALRQELADLEREVASRTIQIGEITTEQNRIRENMKTVAASGQYYERLLAKLNEQESTIERLQRERADFSARRDAKRKELDAYLADLTL